MQLCHKFILLVSPCSMQVYNLKHNGYVMVYSVYLYSPVPKFPGTYKVAMFPGATLPGDEVPGIINTGEQK